MAEKSYFFNSTPEDPRWYQAQDFAAYFKKALHTGIFHENNIPELDMKIVEGERKIAIQRGSAMIKGHLYENTSQLILDVPAASPTESRIDRVCLRLDLSQEARHIKMYIKKGTTKPPQLERNEMVHELSLAQISIPANTVEITSKDLKDERLDNAVCGLVYSLISKQTLADIAYGQYKIVAEDGQIEVDIPMINFDKFRDGLLVFVNKEKAEYDSYFIKDQKTVVFNEPLNEGDVIEFQVTQAVTDPKDDYDLTASNVEVTNGMGIFKSNNVEQALYEVMTQNDYFDIEKEDLNPNDNVFRTIKFLKGNTLIKKQELIDDDNDGLYERQIITFYNSDGTEQYKRTFAFTYNHLGYQIGEKEVFE